MESICRCFFFDAFGGRGKIDATDRTFNAGRHNQRTLPFWFSRTHPDASIYRVQSELDRQDVYEVEISLIDDLDGDTDTYMQTAVTVSGWTIILQDTEM